LVAFTFIVLGFFFIVVNFFEDGLTNVGLALIVRIGVCRGLSLALVPTLGVKEDFGAGVVTCFVAGIRVGADFEVGAGVVGTGAGFTNGAEMGAGIVVAAEATCAITKLLDTSIENTAVAINLFIDSFV